MQLYIEHPTDITNAGLNTSNSKNHLNNKFGVKAPRKITNDKSKEHFDKFRNSNPSSVDFD